MDIKEAQKNVATHLKKIGYDKIETTPVHAFLHLVEEIGETSRTILYQEIKRNSVVNQSQPHGFEEELADIFWQTLKLAEYSGIDLEEAFLKKLQKNKQKSTI